MKHAEQSGASLFSKQLVITSLHFKVEQTEATYSSGKLAVFLD